MRNKIFDLTNSWTKGQRAWFTNWLNTFHSQTKWDVTVRMEHNILMAHCHPKSEGFKPFTVEFRKTDISWKED